MLYEMLTGEQPYKGEQPMQIAFQHATDSVPRPSVKNPGVPEQLDELVLWATEKSPDERRVDAREMLERLREIERELGVSPVVARTGPIGIVRDDSAPTGELTAVLPSDRHRPHDRDGARSTTPAACAARRSAAGRAAAWLIVLVLLLAALAGGLGLVVRLGTRARSSPSPMSRGRRSTRRRDRSPTDSLVAVEQGENSLEVAAGQVIGTNPPQGTRVDKDTEVNVFVSLGPAEVQFASFAGMTEAEARAVLSEKSVQAVDENERVLQRPGPGTVLVVGDPTRRRARRRVAGRRVRRRMRRARGRHRDACGCRVGPVPDVVDQSEGSARSDARGCRTRRRRRECDRHERDDRRGTRHRRERSGGRPWAPGRHRHARRLDRSPAVRGSRRRRTTAATRRSRSSRPPDSRSTTPRSSASFPNAITEVTASDPAAGELRVRGTRVYIQITVTG